ncbi:CHAT domain-containing protein [Streptomyces sp. S.PB5]|uniref:CHAT domain-containing protein n=1 Tax=Streptomyces sp. S.PB5 TaxID=3020844 RepID=UPI0025B1A980|nr:CHAT domain-containing protein [Streptomyces sp. S.PB5]MDN3025894.1 CHAT domain-containing protein [Streptomyces sp. S.PB5]
MCRGACQTGLGSRHLSEGLLGLRRAFVQAGARTLVTSLWQMSDAETETLMTDFYRRVRAGEGRAAALRNAQLALKERQSHPYRWGAFVGQGDPGGLAGLSPGTPPSDEMGQLP